MTQTASAALARKLTAGQEEQGDKPRSVLRALRLGFARAASDGLQLPLSVIGVKQSVGTPDALVDRIGDDWLLLQFLNEDGDVAAACVDLEVAAAVVQVQTIGEVVSTSPSPRAFTHTDGAMVAPLVVDALKRSVELVDSQADKSSLSGYEFSYRLADLRTLLLALSEDLYRVFELTVELGRGSLQGRIAVFLPDRSADDETELADAVASPNLERASGVLRAELDTAICRLSLSLGTLTNLREGEVLPLTGSRLDKIDVLAIDRRRTAIGRLGQSGGMRAIRLNE